MSYVVLRTEKLKTAGSIGGLNAHLTRTMKVPNADPELQKYNTRPIGTTDLNHDIGKRIKSLGIVPRKNAVLAVEHLITSGAEAFNYHKAENGELRGDVNKWKAFESHALGWLVTNYGKENLVNFTVHKDENAPHIHAVIVPVINGKLNCRAFLGGREKLRAMQSSIAEIMKPLGLERGIEGSKATHVALKEFYGNLQKGEDLAKEARHLVSQAMKITLEAPPLLGQKKWKEEQEMMIKEVIQVVAGKYEPIVKTSIQVKEENKHLKQRIKNMSTENVQLKKNNQHLLADLRKVLTTGKIFPGMKEAYIPDILKKELQEKQSENQQQVSPRKSRGIGR
jgi:hypothetical protein